MFRRRQDRGPTTPGERGLTALVLGAGQAGRTLARDLRDTPEFGLRPVGFLDDEHSHRSAAGLPVVGPLAALHDAVVRLGVDVVLVAIPGLPPKELRRLTATATAAGASVRYLPSFLAAIERDARAVDLRSVSLEVLLGRHERDLGEREGRSLVQGRRVLVTGAGGSIGSELCRQLRRFSPSSLHLLDHDESNLHRLQLELSGWALLDEEEIVLADIRDERRVDDVFREVSPHVVLHAAAHKHLPMLERHPCEGVKTNVLGTQNLLRAAAQAGTERFVLVSTDKAADPVSVLGATKRLAELVVQAAAGGSMSVGSVRFGNVLGSRGSLLHTLSSQLRGGEPVTVTHPDVTRFFMTTEEAVGLVLVAASMAEQGETFVLDMGEPVRIVDLVAGYAAMLHVDDYDIRYTGLRPGEKLDERLTGASEVTVPTTHGRICAALALPTVPGFEDRLTGLYEAAEHNDRMRTRRLLQDLVPEYGGSLPLIPTARLAPLVAASQPRPSGDGLAAALD